MWLVDSDGAGILPQKPATQGKIALPPPFPYFISDFNLSTLHLPSCVFLCFTHAPYSSLSFPFSSFLLIGEMKSGRHQVTSLLHGDPWGDVCQYRGKHRSKKHSPFKDILSCNTEQAQLSSTHWGSHVQKYNSLCHAKKRFKLWTFAHCQYSRAPLLVWDDKNRWGRLWLFTFACTYWWVCGIVLLS